MYQKNYVFILVTNIACALLLSFSQSYLTDASQTKKDEMIISKDVRNEHSVTYTVTLDESIGHARTIDYEVLEHNYVIDVSQKDIDTLFRIVEAEAGCEDIKGKLLVANVVINRVRSNVFPNTVREVVYQKNQKSTQFSPVSTGSIDKVIVSEETKEAVYRALYGEDESRGALYFMAREYSDPENVRWFDNNLDFLFTHGGHEFFN